MALLGVLGREGVLSTREVEEEVRRLGEQAAKAN
jgi:hypothetical protein